MTLLLSQLSLNLSHRQVRRDLGNAYDLHRTLSRAFVDGPEAAVKPFLWRLELGRPIEPPRILVQSGAEPIWDQLPEGYVMSLADRAWRPEAVFRAGRAVKLRVLANPTVCRVPTPSKDNPVPEGPARGQRKRLGLWREDEQLEWILRQAQRLGLSEVQAAVSRSERWRCRRGKSPLTVAVAQFDGQAVISDPGALAAGVRSGIGHARMLGLGLVSVAPLGS
ncbi:type I-E CRISPR-associated protein Cas6/Cse3/CasE [Vulcanococcus limneticus]|uniref:type I-E CRISPR-associated protein Cas6/Cse3/CasE n=1 Tax=Vulcanococcus limneticus TaxID=2170428 RepID=UPI00398BC208